MTAPAPADRPSELQRILALPKRPVVNCERDPITKRWDPKAQALVELVTAKYTRGPRLSCGCQDRRIAALGGGRLKIFRSGKANQPPPLPIELTVDSFCMDNIHRPDVVKVVSQLKQGQEAKIDGFGKTFCIEEFQPAQAWFLWELPLTRGAYGIMSVGSGKTVGFIIAPLTMPHLSTWVMMAKPDQRLHYRRHYLQLREHFRVPSIVFDRAELNRDLYGVVPGAPTLHFVPYSVLSSTKSTTLLEDLKPDAVLCDEFHSLANARSSRGGRFLRNMRASNGIVCAGATGSPIDRSIKNCSHLFAHSLGLGSPFPIGDAATDKFSAVLDPSYSPDTKSEFAIEMRRAFSRMPASDDHLIEAGLLKDETINEGFRDRVLSTLGVISTRSSSIECSLVFKERVIKMPSELKEPLSKARLGIRPDQEELAEEAEIASCVRAVAAGYHHYWAYPKSLPEHREPGGLIDRWFIARRDFNKELRAKLAANEPHLDSRALCENAAERAWRVPRYEGDLPVWPADSWPAWAKIKDLVEPDPRTKWMDDFLAQDAANWAKEHVGIVWTRSPAFGERVAQLAGINYHGGGPNAEARILMEDGSKSIVASIKAHSEGRDGLQEKFSHQLLAEMTPSGKRVQQLLGRLARKGQKDDTVVTEVYRHVSEYRDDLRAAVALAEWIYSTSGDRQLLLMADFDFDI